MIIRGNEHPAEGPDTRAEVSLTETQRPAALTPDTVGRAIREIMEPIIQAMGQMIANNTAALEQLAQAQAIQNDRLEALEKQVRLQTPITGTQARYLNDSIRSRARELLNRRGVTDAGSVKKLGAIIRRALLARYGAASMREIPRHEYQVAQSLVAGWSDVLAVRAVANGAKKETEGAEWTRKS